MLFTFFRRAQVYVPDDVFGGGERAVLEARALGVRAVVEPDNPKLAELLGSPVYDHAYYAAQLRYALGLLDLRLAHALGAAAASATAATAGDWAAVGPCGTQLSSSSGTFFAFQSSQKAPSSLAWYGTSMSATYLSKSGS